MRILLLIISILFSSVCFGQGITSMKIDSTIIVNGKVDTLNIPIVTIKESMDFLTSIHKKVIAMKELSLIADREYNSLVNELNRFIGILEKKKKLIK